jgi:acetate kinase
VGAILVLNAGSTSFKLHLVLPDESVRAVESLEAVSSSDIEAVGHRVVHGGRHLVDPTVIDDAVRASIGELRSIAPLHNAPALAGIDAARQAFPGIPHVAVFDTAFHTTIPPEAATYALPRTWREKWGIRRYGFHGLSVQWCSERASTLLGGPDANLRLVVCHLGGGCSVTAVQGRRSVDTTMGFSPLEGVPMATRSGSIDPGALLFVQREHGLSVDEVDRALNDESGLEGLSEGRGLRAVEAAASGDESAQLALGVYTYRIAGAVAAMTAALGGLDGLVFTGGVGENSARVRADVCNRLEFLGVQLDPELNEGASPDADVATPDSAARVLVIAAREELVVARAVRALL